MHLGGGASMDRELVLGFRRGDRDTLTRVYRLHVADVEQIVRTALIGVKAFSASNLADVVQEVFLRAFSKNGRMSDDGLRGYQPYLLVIARDVVLDWARRTGREIPTANLPELEPTGAGDFGAPPDSAFDPVEVSLTAAYIESLSPELRAVHH